MIHVKYRYRLNGDFSMGIVSDTNSRLLGIKVVMLGTKASLFPSVLVTISINTEVLTSLAYQTVPDHRDCATESEFTGQIVRLTELRLDVLGAKSAIIITTVVPRP